MDNDTQAALQHWKSHKYQYHHIPFVDAVRSLSTKKPLVEVKPTARPNEWMVYYIGTSNPAVMTYAGIFSEAEPYDTGNLVWGNNKAPADLEESRITHYAGFRASYSYAIETYHDQEIWQLQRDIEEHVVNNVSGFNLGRVPRLEWQNGHVVMTRFFMRVPMFFPHATRGPQPRAPDGLHPWVRAAHAKSRSHRANPRPPRVRAIEDGKLKPIVECTRPKLEYGDVVGLVFTLSFVATPSNWSPVYMLSDVIRVMDANCEAFPVAVEAEPENTPTYDDDFSIADVPNPSVPPTLTAEDRLATAGPSGAVSSTTLRVPTVSDDVHAAGGIDGSSPPPYVASAADASAQSVVDDGHVSTSSERLASGGDDDDGGTTATDSTRSSPGTSTHDDTSTDATVSTPARYVTHHLLADSWTTECADSESSQVRGSTKSRKPLVPLKTRRGGAVVRGAGTDA